MRFRRAKIVCTIGPACDTEAKLVELMKAGMDVARLNFSHGTHEEHGARLERIRAASKVCEKPVAVLQDLCGPKIRAGKFNRLKPEYLAGTTAYLVEAGPLPPEDDLEIPVQYEGLAADLQPGDGSGRRWASVAHVLGIEASASKWRSFTVACCATGGRVAAVEACANKHPHRKKTSRSAFGSASGRRLCGALVRA